MELSIEDRDNLNQISRTLLGSAMAVHKEMGPGLLESVYHHCLVKELSQRSLKIETNVPVQLHYKGESLSKLFYVDMLLENSIIVELKAIEGILPVHQAQLLSYLKLTNLNLGFIINFNVVLIKDGFKRIVNNF